MRAGANFREQRTPYVITAPVQANRTGESIAVLIDQYRSFTTDKGITKDERDRTINGNVRSLPGSFETSAAILGALRQGELYERKDDYWETLGARYEAMTAAAMDAAARSALKPADIVWVVVGDAKLVRPQLASLGLPIEERAAP